MMDKFYVKVVRLAVEATVVEVEAATASDAQLAAIEIAARSPAWTSIAGEDYTLHPLAAFESDEVQDVNDLLFADSDKFIALYADASTGEGIALPEPWMEEQSRLAIADIAGDWVEQLTEIQDESAEAFRSHLSTVKAESKVIDFAKAVAYRRLKPTHL